MATTQNTFNGDGSNLGPFSFTFKWLESTDIKVSVGGVLKAAGTHYNLQGLNYTTKTGGQVLFTAGNAPPTGTNNIRIYRDTDDDALSATFSSGSAIRAKDLNDNFTQNLYVTQEVNNNAVNIDGSNPMVGNLNLNNFKAINSAAPSSGADLANKTYVDDRVSTSAVAGSPYFLQDGAVFNRSWSSKLKDVVSVKDFGAAGDGTDDTAAIQAALDSGAGSIVFPPGTYLVNNTCLVPSNTNLIGAGIGVSVIKNPIPGRFSFRNKDYATTGNENITISNFTFDSNGTADSGISVIAVDNLLVDKCEFVNIKPTGVTNGIGYATLTTQPSKNVIITNCFFDVPDYGIVFECSGSRQNLSNITIDNCIIKTAWGSGISLSGDISNVNIGQCIFELPGDGNSVDANGPEMRVGIGVKLWQGSNVYNAPETIAITGCTFRGNVDIYLDWTPWALSTGYVVGDHVSRNKKNYVCIAAHTSSATDEPGVGVNSATYWYNAELKGISAANWTNELTITGNSFRWLSSAFENDFAGTDADTLVFSSNAIEFCYRGFDNSISSDVSPIITSNAFRNVDSPIRSSLRYSNVSSNQFRNIGSKAIDCNSPSEGASIVGNTFKDIGEEAIYIAGTGANNNLYLIQGNYFDSCSTKTNSGFPVLQARAADFVFSNNVVFNDGTNRPSYAIGRPTPNDNNSIITGNWMFGFRVGYQQNTGSSDVYANNRERGGIGP